MRMSSERRVGLWWAVAGLAVATSCFSTGAQDQWPQFRGPGSRGVGESDKLPIAWSTASNVVWKAEIPGRGWSSPIVWGDRVWVTTAVSEGEVEPPKKGLYFGGERPEVSHDRHHWQVICLQRDDGRVLWSTDVHSSAPSQPIHVKNSYASETPVTDGKHVYAYFGSVGLYCLDLEGKVVWEVPFKPVKMRYGWGSSASPVLHEGRVYVVNDNEEESFLAAFDGQTGKELWRVKRDEPSNFATPFVWANEQRTELVVPGRNRVRSYDLKGNVLWHFQGMSTITIPTPFAADGLLYLCAGYVGDKLRPNKPVYAVKPGGSGDLTLSAGERSSASIAWMEADSAPYNPSALVYQGRFYVLWDFGFLSCRDAKTGREMYGKERVNPEGRAGFTASPWAYRGRVFCLSEDGDTYVFEAGDKLKLERVNALEEMCMATPAISGDKLIVRTMSKVYCLGER